jgi:hypothetical protein
MIHRWGAGLSVLARSESEFLVRYVEDGRWLAVWDKATLTEIVRVSETGSWPIGASIDDPAEEAAIRSFGRALIDQLKKVSDPKTARIRAAETRITRSFSLRERDTQGEKMTYLTVRASDRRRTGEMQATSYCIRTGTGASLASKLAEGKRNAEVPKTAPTTADLSVDYLDGILGKDIETWRREGFIANPLVMLDRSPDGDCFQR